MKKGRDMQMDKLLKILKTNARLSVEDLAALAGLSPEETAAKIEGYEKSGVIKGYMAVTAEDFSDTDSVTAFIEVKVTPQAENGFDQIAKTIMSFEEVDSVTLMAGSFDLAVTLSGANYKEVALFVARRLSTLPGVLSTSTHFVLKRYKESGFVIDGEVADERGLVSP